MEGMNPDLGFTFAVPQNNLQAHSGPEFQDQSFHIAQTGNTGPQSKVRMSRPPRIPNRKAPVNVRKPVTSGSSASSRWKQPLDGSSSVNDHGNQQNQPETRMVYLEQYPSHTGYLFTENPAMASNGRFTAGRASFNSPPAMQQQAWTSQPDLSTTHEHQADNPQQRLPRRPVSWPTMNGYMPAHMNPQSSYQFGMFPAASLLTPQTSSQGSNESSDDPPQTSSRKFQLLAAERDHYKTIAENSVPLRDHQKVIAECNHYKITNEKLGIAINQKDAELAAVRQKAVNAETQAGIFLNLLQQAQPPLRATHEIVKSAGYSAIANAIAPSTYESPYGPPATAGKSAQTLIRKAQSPPNVNPAKRIKINDSRTLTVNPAQISNIEPAKAANQDHVSQSEPSNSIQALDHVESVAQSQSQPVPQAQTLDQAISDFLKAFPGDDMLGDGMQGEFDCGSMMDGNTAQISNIEPANAANQDHVSQSEPSNSIQALDHVESVAQSQSQPVPQAQTLDQEFSDFVDSSEEFPANEMPGDVDWGSVMDGLEDFNFTGICNPETGKVDQVAVDADNKPKTAGEIWMEEEREYWRQHEEPRARDEIDYELASETEEALANSTTNQ